MNYNLLAMLSLAIISIIPSVFNVHTSLNNEKLLVMNKSLLEINDKLMDEAHTLQKETVSLNIKLLETDIEKLDLAMLGLNASLAMAEHIAKETPSNDKAKGVVTAIKIQLEKMEKIQEESIKKTVSLKSSFMKQYLF